MNLIELLQGSIVVFTLILGICVQALKMPIDIHRHSTNIYLISALGFIHQVFCTLHWIKESFDPQIINQCVVDMYTVPTLLFVMCVLVASSSFNPFSRSEEHVTGAVLYVFCSLCLVVAASLIGLFRIDGLKSNVHAANTSNDISLLQTFCPKAPYVFVEYILIYIPATLVICIGGIKDWLVYTEQKPSVSVCQVCEENKKLCKHITIVFYVVIWVIRPVLLVLTSYFNFMKEDIIPSLTILTIYLYLLWYCLTNDNVKNQDLCIYNNENRAKHKDCSV